MYSDAVSAFVAFAPRVHCLAHLCTVNDLEHERLCQRLDLRVCCTVIAIRNETLDRTKHANRVPAYVLLGASAASWSLVRRTVTDAKSSFSGAEMDFRNSRVDLRDAHASFDASRSSTETIDMRCKALRSLLVPPSF